MRENLIDFYKTSLKNFLEAIGNLFIFLPYFFSVKTLLKTLFVPWRNLVAKKTTPGFSFSEFFERLAFNEISRVIGAIMRISVLIFYLLLQTLYILILPFIIIVYVFLIPLLYLESLFTKTKEESKKILHDNFVSSHLQKEENRHIVEQWFETYYKKHLRKQAWWKISNLFTIPPLARDWAVGFTPTLDEYAEDLTTTQYQLRREHIIDRQKEIAQIEQIIAQSEEANVLIVGEEGVGKHTIVDALAKKIYEGRTNPILMYKRVLKLNMEKILTQYTDQKQREHFFDILLKEAEEAKNIITLVNDFEKYIAADETGVDLTSSFEKFAKYSFVQFIGIMNPFAYQKYIISNPIINRLFTKVDVYEVPLHEAEEILLDNTYIYEQKYNVHIPYETIHAIIEKSNFFITIIPFPEKAIHLLNTACVYATTRKAGIVLPEYIDVILSETTHIPTVVSNEMKEKLVTLETLLHSQIVQQQEAIQELSSTLRRSFVLIGKRKKPLATFLFLGPTGVGKTQTAKSIASIFFGSEKYLIRFDMSLYQTVQDIEKLIGSIDSKNPGLLTAAIRETPYGVLLLDELEKANKDLLNIFLTLLDEGYFTDGFGKKIDCRNLVVIATSNAASDKLYKNAHMENKDIINYLIEQKLFSPEFLNRFDGIVIYKPLTEESIILIARKIIDEIAQDILKLYKIKLIVSDEYLSLLAHKGYDPKFGARNMERLIRDEIEDKVAKMVLENQTKEGDIIRL